MLRHCDPVLLTFGKEAVIMKPSGRPHRIIVTWVILATILSTTTAHAQNKSYWVLYDFGQEKSDGWNPSPPAVAKNGDLYGVTGGGGDYNSGTAFKLTAPKSRGGKWKWSSLYEFPGGDGGAAPGLPMLGGDGNLYGAEYSYSVFELSAPKSGDGVWKYELLYTLNETTDGAGVVGLVMDEKGNIYGATQGGGDMSGCNHYGCGTVFELKRPTKNGGKWSFSVLYTFTGDPDGAEPFAGVTLDQNGNVYGTTFTGGAMGNGSIYPPTPPAKKGHPWTETILYSFDSMGNNGIGPESPLLFDSAGNLYGTTEFGGDLNCSGGFGGGGVYESSPPAKRGESWNFTTLYAFQGGNDGAVPL